MDPDHRRGGQVRDERRVPVPAVAGHHGAFADTPKWISVEE
ncbi:hypothetical protein [Rhodococcus sp. NPDC003348]